MSEPPTCAREGCGKHALGDEFCSTYCYRRAHGVIDPMDVRKRINERRRIAYLHRKHGAGEMEFVNEHVNVPRGEGPRIRRIRRRG